MKRYILFGGADYYPSGGWDDFVATEDSVETLVAVARQLQSETAQRYYGATNTVEWAHIVDTADMTVQQLPHGWRK